MADCPIGAHTLKARSLAKTDLECRGARGEEVGACASPLGHFDSFDNQSLSD